jgi:hypothetical protein
VVGFVLTALELRRKITESVSAEQNLQSSSVMAQVFVFDTGSFIIPKKGRSSGISRD